MDQLLQILGSFWQPKEELSYPRGPPTPHCHRNSGIKETLQHHLLGVEESGITLFQPGCAMEIIPSTHPRMCSGIHPNHTILYQTFPIFICKKPQKILIPWSQVTLLLVLDRLFIIDPFNASLVPIFHLSYPSFPTLAAPIPARG